MANQVSSVDVPLSIFGSLDTELSPADIPEGASPANNDVVYLPGSVATRPGLSRLFAPEPNGPFTYEKSFVLPSGQIKNLYLTADGILWVEDVTNSPGTLTQLFVSAGAAYASSVTALGREYIALSDGQHGADIPLQYDGTNLYRVTIDGPGAPPTVSSIALPPSTMAAISARVDTIDQIFTAGDTGGHFTTVVISLTAPDTAIAVGQTVTVAGSTAGGLNLTYTVAYVFPDFTAFYCSFYSATNQMGTGGTATFPAGVTASRAANTVTVATATDHGLQVGYQAQISGVPATVVGGSISTIVLNNEDNPGIATVTTSAAHGLLPNNQVNIQGVSGATVGTAITNVAFAGNLVTVTTSAAHGLSIGSEVIVTAITNTTVNGEWVVLSVPSTTTFTYAFVSIVTAYTAADTGSVTYLWPLANVNPAQNYFTVQTAPTSTTFTISLSYTDGTWTGGTASFPWDGIFFVTKILSTTSFQYQQYGPDTTTAATGTVTPYGQATPGIHQCRVSWLTASGEISAPSPQTTFVANGGQYLSVNNLPIGPANVVGRVIQFTGAGGAYFFYIPVPAQVNGLTVSTGTQVNDNTTTGLILDFSDNTLYAASGVSIPGNNLAAQVVLGPCAGFFSYASRLLAWGERNKIQNLVNMAFDGGTLSGSTDPLGWSGSDGHGAVIASRLGSAWQITIVSAATPQGALSQSAYLDTYGAPILSGNTLYKVRAWIKTSVQNHGLVVRFELASNTGPSPFASITGDLLSLTGSYVEIPFNVKTGVTINPDTIIDFFAEQVATTGDVVTITEIEIIPVMQPYLNNISRISYAENAGGFDALTGVIGAADDLSPICNFGVIRQALYLVTQSGLHETADNQQTEPSSWNVEQVADNCGGFGIAAVSRNPQGVGSAFKDSMMWNGPDGAQIFTGQKPWKVSQEVQSIWDTLSQPSNSVNSYQCWAKNDETNKRCYFGFPAMGAQPRQVMVLDYRNIDGANLPENPPVHISFTGKMIVSDLTRKWTPWTAPAASGELLYRSPGAQPQMTFGCADPNGNANAYILDPTLLSDSDFGTIPWSYTTYFFVSHEQEQALQVGSHRHVYTLAQAFISGVGLWYLTPYAASLSNPFPDQGPYPLSSDPVFDMDFGINVETTRCAFKISGSPTITIPANKNSYAKLTKLVINMAPAPWAKVRGSSQGLF